MRCAWSAASSPRCRRSTRSAATSWPRSCSRICRRAVEVMVFPRTMTDHGHALEDDAIVCVKGRVDLRDDVPKLIAMEITRPELVLDGGPPVRIKGKLGALSDDTVGAAQGDPRRAPGRQPGVRAPRGLRQDHRAAARRRVLRRRQQRPLRRAPRSSSAPTASPDVARARTRPAPAAVVRAETAAVAESECSGARPVRRPGIGVSPGLGWASVRAGSRDRSRAEARSPRSSATSRAPASATLRARRRAEAAGATGVDDLVPCTNHDAPRPASS